MNPRSFLQPDVLIAALLVLLPFCYAAFLPEHFASGVRAMPRLLRIAVPSLVCVPYVLVARAFGSFHWSWFALYALLPPGIAFILDQARAMDARRRGNWRDFAVLIALGLAVDLRWFESAWPQGFTVFGKMLLLNAGIYAFLGRASTGWSRL